MKGNTSLHHHATHPAVLEVVGSNNSAMMFVDSLIDQVTRRIDLFSRNGTGQELRQLIEESSLQKSEERQLKGLYIPKADHLVQLIEERISNSGNELIEAPERHICHWLSTLDSWTEKIRIDHPYTFREIIKALSNWPYRRRIRTLIINDLDESTNYPGTKFFKLLS